MHVGSQHDHIISLQNNVDRLRAEVASLYKQLADVVETTNDMAYCFSMLCVGLGTAIDEVLMHRHKEDEKPIDDSNMDNMDTEEDPSETT